MSVPNDEIRIELEPNSRWTLGEPIEGTLVFLTGARPAARLVFVWRCAGGDRTVETGRVEGPRLEPPGVSKPNVEGGGPVRVPFRAEAPRWPPSFTGPNVSLSWSVAVRHDDGELADEVPVTLCPATTTEGRATSTSAAKEAGSVPILAALTLATGAAAAYGFAASFVPLQVLGTAGFAMFALGTGLTLRSWAVARKLGALSIVVRPSDYLGLPRERPGRVECRVARDSGASAPRMRGATLRVVEALQNRAGSTVKGDCAPRLYEERIELEPADGCDAGAFVVPATDTLPFPFQTAATSVRWLIALEASDGHVVELPVRFEAASELSARP